MTLYSVRVPSRKKMLLKHLTRFAPVLGEGVVSHNTCKYWFRRFKDGNFGVSNRLLCGAPRKVVADDLKTLFIVNPWQTQGKLAEQLGVHRTTIFRLLHRVGEPQTLGNRVPHKFLKNNSNMPPKRTSRAKANSSKATSDKKTEVLNKTSRKKREIDTDDEPASKRTKIESKETKHESSQSATKKSKNEPKQMLNKTDTNLDEIDFACTKTNEEGEKYNLKICTWNISGIRAVVKKNGMDYIAKEDADIVALQETKCDKDKIPEEVNLPGYHNYFLDSKKAGYCGVALFAKEKPITVKYGLNNSTFDGEGRIITAEFSEFFVVNVYVPNAGQKLVTLPKRLEWNKTFKKHIEKLDEKKPVIICGDMNVAHQEIDLKNPKTNTKNAGFTKEERDGMTDFLAAGYVDSFRLLYPDQEGAYTFWSYFANARSKDIGWRLDYFLISDRIKNKVCDNVIRKQVYGSDHCPVILYINL